MLPRKGGEAWWSPAPESNRTHPLGLWDLNTSSRRFPYLSFAGPMKGTIWRDHSQAHQFLHSHLADVASFLHDRPRLAFRYVPRHLPPLIALQMIIHLVDSGLARNGHARSPTRYGLDSKKWNSCYHLGTLQCMDTTPFGNALFWNDRRLDWTR